MYIMLSSGLRIASDESPTRTLNHCPVPLALYDGMVRIVVTPTWAKLIDFETTLPSAVEEPARQRDERQRS